MKLNNTYLLFTADHCPRKAAERYRQRYGCKPKDVEVHGRYLIVGPLDENEAPEYHGEGLA